MRISDWSSDVGSSDLAASDDREIGQRQGITDIELGLRLRYEIGDRAIAPYIGVHWEKKLGETATIARSEGEDTDEARVVAGEIGRATCRERVCQYVSIAGGAGTLHKTKQRNVK